MNLGDNLYRVHTRSRSDWSVQVLEVVGITVYRSTTEETTTYHLQDQEGGVLQWRMGDPGIKLFASSDAAFERVERVRSMSEPEVGQILLMRGQTWLVKTIHREKGQIEAVTLSGSLGNRLIAYSTFLTEVDL